MALGKSLAKDLADLLCQLCEGGDLAIGVSRSTSRDYICPRSPLSLLNCLKTYLMWMLRFYWGGYARVVMSLTGMRDGCLRFVGSKEAANDLLLYSEISESRTMQEYFQIVNSVGKEWRVSWPVTSIVV